MTLTHDVNHKIERITNNFGRWIELDRSVVGGVEVVTKVTTDDSREVNYNYTTLWSPTGEQTLTSVEYPRRAEAAYTWAGAIRFMTGRSSAGQRE